MVAAVAAVSGLTGLGGAPGHYSRVLLAVFLAPPRLLATPAGVAQEECFPPGIGCALVQGRVASP